MTLGRPDGLPIPLMVAVSIGGFTRYWSGREAKQVADCLDQQVEIREENISLMLGGFRYSLCREVAIRMSQDLREAVFLLRLQG